MQLILTECGAPQKALLSDRVGQYLAGIAGACLGLAMPLAVDLSLTQADFLASLRRAWLPNEAQDLISMTVGDANTLPSGGRCVSRTVEVRLRQGGVRPEGVVLCEVAGQTLMYVHPWRRSNPKVD